MTKQARDYTAKAAVIVNAGSAIKSRIKEANEDLARAFEIEERKVRDALLDVMREERENGNAVIVEGREVYAPDSLMAKANAAYYNLPFDLHNWRAKHRVAVEAVVGAEVLANEFAAIENLFALRAEVKAVEVVKHEKKDNVEEKIKMRAMKSFEEWLKDRKGTFNWTKSLLEAFNAEVEFAEDVVLKGVSINQVFCQNYAGTRWIRVDWFMMGKKVPFQIIMGAAEAVADTKKK